MLYLFIDINLFERIKRETEYSNARKEKSIKITNIFYRLLIAQKSLWIPVYQVQQILFHFSLAISNISIIKKRFWTRNITHWGLVLLIHTVRFSWNFTQSLGSTLLHKNKAVHHIARNKLMRSKINANWQIFPVKSLLIKN